MHENGIHIEGALPWRNMTVTESACTMQGAKRGDLFIKRAQGDGGSLLVLLSLRELDKSARRGSCSRVERRRSGVWRQNERRMASRAMRCHGDQMARRGRCVHRRKAPATDMDAEWIEQAPLNAVQ
jgi:hypothetical protein